MISIFAGCLTNQDHTHSPTKHLSSGDYDTWIVTDVRIQILSLTTLTKQGHVVCFGGPTSGTFVVGWCDTFIPLFRDDHRGYYVLPVKAPSFRAAGLKPDITLQRRPLRLMAPSSTLPLTMTLARSLQPLHSLRPLPRCLRRPASGRSPTSRWALRLMPKTLTRTRMARHLRSARCSRMPHWPSTFSEFMRSLVTLISSASFSSSVMVK